MGYQYRGKARKAAPECGTMAAVAVHLRAGAKPRELDYKCRVALSDYKAAHNRLNRTARADMTEEQAELQRVLERARYTPRAELPPEQLEAARAAGREKSKREPPRRELTEEERERRRERDREAYARRQAAKGKPVVPRGQQPAPAGELVELVNFDAMLARRRKPGPKRKTA